MPGCISLLIYINRTTETHGLKQMFGFSLVYMQQ